MAFYYLQRTKPATAVTRTTKCIAQSQGTLYNEMPSDIPVGLMGQLVSAHTLTFPAMPGNDLIKGKEKCNLLFESITHSDTNA